MKGKLMDQMNIARRFATAYKHKNFLTPNVVEFGETEKFIYELSSGEGIRRGSKMFGVTVLEKDGTKRHDLNSGGLGSEAAARSHISQLDTMGVLA